MGTFIYENKHHPTVWRSLGLAILALVFSTYTVQAQDGATCNAPIIITELPFSDSGNTSSYGNDYGSADVPAVAPGAITNGTSSYASYITGDDVVFAITPVIDGQITINTTNDDDWIGLFAFTGCPFTSTVGYHTATSGATRSIPNLPVLANVTYYIVISTWPTPQSTNFTINIDGTPGLLAPLEACDGTPAGGIVTVNPAINNPGASYTVAASGYSTGLDLTYQWQYSEDGGNTWNNAGDAGEYAAYTANAPIELGSTIQWRLEVYCENSDETSASQTATFTTGLVYCTSAPTSNDNSGISNVTVGLTSFPVADVFYYNYTGTPASISAGTVVPASVTFATGYSYHCNIWIDLNDNGVFDATELVFQGESSNANPTTLDTSFPLPSDAPQGVHKMRIGSADSGQATPNPCYSGPYGITIDLDVEVTEPPVCLAPTDLSISFSGLTGTLSWAESNGPDGNYEYVISTTNETPSGNGTAVSGASAELNDLEEGNTYYVFVRSNCGDDGYSTWTMTSFYAGYCQVTSTNTLYGISNFTTTGGYSNINNTTGSGTYSNYSATQFVSQSAEGVVNFSVTPVSGTNGIGVWIDWNNNYIFEASEMIYNSAGFVSSASGTITVPTGTPNGNYRMRVVANWSATTPTPCGNLGNISSGEAEDYTFVVAPLPTCVAPSDIITTTTDSSVEFSWTASPSNPTIGYAWELLGADNTVINAGVATDLSTIVTGLAANTSYTINLIAVCDVEEMSFATSTTFTTACGAMDIPYYENFDGVTTPNVPTCYVVENTNGDSNAWKTTSGYSNSAPNAMQIQWNSSLTMDDWFYLPGLNLEEGTSYRLKYGYRVGGGSYPENLEVFYGSGANSSAMQTSLGDHPEITNTAYETNTVDFTVDASGVYYIGFHGYSDPDQFYLIVDDIQVTLTPQCAEPANLNVETVTEDSVEFSWGASASDPAEGYAWEIFDGNSNLIASGNTNDLSATASGLSPLTNYTIYVRSACGDDSESESIFIDFETPCAIIDTFPFTETFEENSESLDCWGVMNEDATWFLNYGSSYGDVPAPHTGELNVALDGFGDAVLLSPIFDMTSLASTGAELEFWYANPDFTGDVDELTVYYKSSASGDWTPIPGAFINTPIDDWTQVTYALPEISNYYQLAFEGIAVVANLVLDDVTIRQATAICNAPTNLDVNSITTNSVEISWTEAEPAPANGYEWEVLDTENTVIATGTTQNLSIVVEGLDSNTDYVVHIRSLCSDDESSDWTENADFSTSPILGCTDPTACNYNSEAEEDDGSCSFDPITWYQDSDGDGYGNSAITELACEQPEGYVLNNTDCNDEDANVWQSAELYVDADGDGYGAGMETVCYGENIPDGYQSTSLGEDCNDEDANIWQSAELYIDADGDGYGAGMETVCYGENIPDGYQSTSLGEDCNDEDANVWQSAELYVDADGDGYGAGMETVCYGENIPDGYQSTSLGEDCNDEDENVWQSAELYVDADGDGYHGAAETICYGEEIPEGYTNTSLGEDCNDEDANVWQSAELYVDADGDGYHGAAETICYGENIPDGYQSTSLGEDCNDEDENVWQSAELYIDADGDGYHGAVETICYGEEIPEGYTDTSLGEDCDDTNDAIWTAVEIEIELTLPVSVVCDNGGSITLSGGTPAGGVWGGQSVTNGVFNPAGLAPTSYTITYTVQGDGVCVAGNSTSAAIEVDDCSGVEEDAANQIRIYPTVANDFVTIEGSGLVEATIIDMNGRHLNTISLHSTSTIEISQYAAGIYFVQVTSKTATEIFKVVKVN